MSLSFKIKEIPEISSTRSGTPKRVVREVPQPVIAAALEGEAGDPSASVASLEVELFRDHDEVMVRGKLHARLSLACGRCVEPAEVDVDVPVEAMFKREGAEEEAEEPADVEALMAAPDAFEHDGVTISLDELVREILVAEVPISPLCSPGCLGLCPTCGANRNTAEGKACGHSGAPEGAPRPDAEPSPDGGGSKKGLKALANLKLSS